MKGWMQTFIVHNRDPGRLLAEMGLPAFLAFETLVLGMIAAPLLHCAFLASLGFRVALGAPLIDGSLWTVFYLAMLALGYGSAVAMALLGLFRLKARHLLASQLWLPLYWLFVGIATFKAAHELVMRPFYWFKSPHRPAASSLRPAAGRLANLFRRLRRS
jgi:glycosyltransferase XagB